MQLSLRILGHCVWHIAERHVRFEEFGGLARDSSHLGWNISQFPPSRVALRALGPFEDRTFLSREEIAMRNVVPSLYSKNHA